MGRRKNIAINLNSPYELNYAFKYDCRLLGIALINRDNNSSVEITKAIDLAGDVIIPEHSNNILNRPADDLYFPKTMMVGLEVHKNETINGAFSSNGNVTVILNIEED